MSTMPKVINIFEMSVKKCSPRLSKVLLKKNFLKLGFIFLGLFTLSWINV